MTQLCICAVYAWHAEYSQCKCNVLNAYAIYIYTMCMRHNVCICAVRAGRGHHFHALQLFTGCKHTKDTGGPGAWYFLVDSLTRCKHTRKALVDLVCGIF